jgi:hypothetical protein
MDGLVTGRIVYYVLNEEDAAQINRRRTTARSIADRIAVLVRTYEPPPTPDSPVGVFVAHVPSWPLGAQAHIGNDVVAGQIVPAMVVAVWGDVCVNLKAMLDGTDTYWATSRNYHPDKAPGSWHWMFDGQATRHAPSSATPPASQQ